MVLMVGRHTERRGYISTINKIDFLFNSLECIQTNHLNLLKTNERHSYHIYQLRERRRQDYTVPADAKDVILYTTLYNQMDLIPSSGTN